MCIVTAWFWVENHLILYKWLQPAPEVGEHSQSSWSPSLLCSGSHRSVGVMSIGACRYVTCGCGCATGPCQQEGYLGDLGATNRPNHWRTGAHKQVLYIAVSCAPTHITK